MDFLQRWMKTRIASGPEGLSISTQADERGLTMRSELTLTIRREEMD